ncbi:shTK domain protein [Ostertagia ostertagi]
MACNCQVSCGHCIPLDYGYGSCLDYHRDCSGWARRGECEKNPWMSENCRASCRTCYSQWDLRTMCRGAVGSVAPVATNRPRQPVVTRPPPAWQHRGGFGRGGMDYEDWGGLMGWGNGAGGGIANGWGGPPPMWQQPFSWFRRARAKRD